MFTDMVGFTALGQRNESLSLAMVDEQRQLIRPVLNKHSGREIKTIGDAFMVEFTSALEAVRCAYDIQRATREYNLSQPEERRIHLRVGVHLGDVVESGGDISGDAVNLASRIEHLAEDGGVCLTRQVYDHVNNKFELPLKSLGLKQLKNIRSSVEVFKMQMPWDAGVSAPSTELDPKRIAVLPFANMSPDSADEYFADGMTEELISTLSRVSGLKVIARTSVMGYKGGQKKIPEIAKELDVGTILEGSVRKSGDRLRITAQLINAATSDHLWVESYDRQLKDVFAIQSEVAARVAEALSLGLLSKPGKNDSTNVEAYTSYLRALQFYHESTEPSLREAITLFERSLSRDPNFVRAHAGLAVAWGRMAQGGYEEFTVALERAEAAANRAVELGPEWGESHGAMATVNWYMDKVDEVIPEAERALRINPNLSEAHLAVGMTYSTLGRLEEGIQFLRKAYELDPLSLTAGHDLALVLKLAGRDGEAFDLLSRLLQFNSRNPRMYEGFAEFFMLRRDFDKAQEMLDKGLGINSSEFRLMLNQGLLFAFTGREGLALDQLARIMQEKRESVRIYGQMFIHAALGHVDESLEALVRGAEQHVWPALVLSLPVFEGVRKHRGFSDFCVKAGLPVPPQERG